MEKSERGKLLKEENSTLVPRDYDEARADLSYLSHGKLWLHLETKITTLTLSQATHLLDKQHLEGDKSFIHQLLIRAKQLTSWTNSIWKVISPLYTSL